MSNDDIDKLRAQINKLQHDYEELKNEFEDLLLQDVKKSKPRIIGAFTSAGATLEKLLTYIIRKEGKEKQLISDDGKHVGLNQLKIIAQDFIPKEQVIHINSIMHWRNHVAHGNDIDKVNVHELRAVNSSLQSFVDWFFKDYLKNEFDLSKNSYSKKDNETESTKEEITGFKRHRNSNPLNIPDYSILLKSKKVPKKKKKSGILVFLLLCSCLIYALYHFGFEDLSSENRNDHSVITPMNKDQTYEFLNSYYNSLRDPKSDAHKFFADKVDQFYLKKNVNPTEIDIIRQTNAEFIDAKNSFNKESLYLSHKNDSITYWVFSNEFICYRTSLRKFQKCTVQVEFGINNNNKITSIKEISFSKPSFSKTKPY